MAVDNRGMKPSHFQPKPTMEQDFIVCGAQVGEIYHVSQGCSIGVASSPVILTPVRWVLLRISSKSANVTLGRWRKEAAHRERNRHLAAANRQHPRSGRSNLGKNDLNLLENIKDDSKCASRNYFVLTTQNFLPHGMQPRLWHQL
jgi:hypothetical protein